MVCILRKITMHWYNIKRIRYKIKFSSNGEISSLKRAATMPVSPLRMPFISLRRSREAVFRRPVVLGQGCQSQATVVYSSTILFYSSNFTNLLFFLKSKNRCNLGKPTLLAPNAKIEGFCNIFRTGLKGPAE